MITGQGLMKEDMIVNTKTFESNSIIENLFKED